MYRTHSPLQWLPCLLLRTEAAQSSVDAGNVGSGFISPIAPPETCLLAQWGTRLLAALAAWAGLVETVPSAFYIGAVDPLYCIYSASACHVYLLLDRAKPNGAILSSCPLLLDHHDSQLFTQSLGHPMPPHAFGIGCVQHTLMLSLALGTSGVIVSSHIMSSGMIYRLSGFVFRNLYGTH